MRPRGLQLSHPGGLTINCEDAQCYYEVRPTGGNLRSFPLLLAEEGQGEGL
jgi:hypothetical protein